MSNQFFSPIFALQAPEMLFWQIKKHACTLLLRILCLSLHGSCKDSLGWPAIYLLWKIILRWYCTIFIQICKSLGTFQIIFKKYTRTPLGVTWTCSSFGLPLNTNQILHVGISMSHIANLYIMIYYSYNSYRQLLMTQRWFSAEIIFLFCTLPRPTGCDDLYTSLYLWE